MRFCARTLSSARAEKKMSCLPLRAFPDHVQATIGVDGHLGAGPGVLLAFLAVAADLHGLTDVLPAIADDAT